jgi:hypothetical protein
MHLAGAQDAAPVVALGDRDEALARLTLLLAVSFPVALAVVSAGGCSPVSSPRKSTAAAW